MWIGCWLSVWLVGWLLLVIVVVFYDWFIGVLCGVIGDEGVVNVYIIWVMVVVFISVVI